MINSEILRKSDEFRQSFESSNLHKHVCIDDFFELVVAQKLLDEFPPFDNTKAIDEFGDVGPKCVHNNIQTLGPAYKELHTYIHSTEFLSAISSFTGIPDLLPDPNLYGGGTHENLDGAELDPHVDFNYDPITLHHRRLNVLFYLNHEWQEEWGGGIEFHSDPTQWPKENDRVISFNCLFNRCVIFATNEDSWHGFQKIRLPEDKKNSGLSRKLISIYLYTKTRPLDEIAPSHSTFYVPYPPRLPTEQKKLRDYLLKDEYISDAVALTADEYKELVKRVEKRDKLLKASFATEKRLSGDIGNYGKYIQELSSAIHPTFLGYVKPVNGSTSGYFHDKWSLKKLTTSIQIERDVHELVINGWIPDENEILMKINVENSIFLEKTLLGGMFQIHIKTSLEKDTITAITVISERTKGEICDTDSRGDLLFILNSIDFFH
ncbi:2OG-Fe(II) oxygenase [Marinomonas shanghaiensis]|uniref:2OG-Fe(II) oxygenase n=1 Tax=Marinomonas shanghaiensis TaxID=2202418 RepID=UPI003A943688